MNNNEILINKQKYPGGMKSHNASKMHILWHYNLRKDRFYNWKLNREADKQAIRWQNTNICWNTSGALTI